MGRSTHPEDENNFGDPIKYDPDFNGPLKRRSCTDILCLLLFVVFIGCWVGVGIYAFKTGDMDSLLIPTDSMKRKCGHDSEVLGKPYLFFLDITKCFGPDVLITGCTTEQVCVDKCPSTTYYYDKGKVIDKDKLICNQDISGRDDTYIRNLTENNLCAKWYVPSEPITHRCLPKISDDLLEFLKNTSISTISKIETAVKNIKVLAQAEEMVAVVTEDIINSWWKILIGLGASLVVCFIYIFLMRWVATYVVWASLIGFIAILSYGIYKTFDMYKTFKVDPNVDNSEWQKYAWLAFLIVLSAILILTLLILIFLRKRIVIAIALIKEGSKAVSACVSSLFFPLLPWIVQILVLAYAVFTGLYLSSIGERIYRVYNVSESCIPCNNFKNGDICDPLKFKECYDNSRLKAACAEATCSLATVQNPSHVKILHAINVVGGFWGTFFVSAFGEMVLAATFATWYWTFKKSNVPFFTVTQSMYRALRFHIGTLAFGSLIITICRLIRVAIEYVDHKLKKYDNALIKAVLCCCKCFFWCLEKFLKFINKNAYIMCAIHGKNFCASAKDAFSLLMRNILRVFVLDKVTDLLFFLGKILITACVGTVAYEAFKNPKYINAEDLHYNGLVPVILISVGAFFISNVFFGVYAMAVDTLFLCFLEDCERNDGSTDKPYYMSKELMKILGKKNKKNK